MEENMNTPVTPAETKSKSKTPMIIAIVAVVLLCCCCFGGAALWWLWTNGDNLINGLNTGMLIKLLA